MWNVIMERLPTFSQWMYTFLAFIVPFTVYKVNQRLHAEMDPPWKKEENKSNSDKKQPSN